MTQIITTYLAVILLVSAGFFGVGALASAEEPQDLVQPSTVTQPQSPAAR